MNYLSVAEARDLPGLRLALTAHIPAPWGEAVKAVLKVRGVKFHAVGQALFEPNEELRAWTGFRNAPVAVLDNEPAVANWHQIVLLAERLGSGPSLLPDDPIERALSIGFSAEICGPDGFGWNRRLTATDPNARSPDAGSTGAEIQQAYGIRADAIAAAAGRVVAILQGLTEQLRRQQGRGSRYLVGDRLSACDLHWAGMSEMVAPLAHEDCAMPGWLREIYAKLPPEIADALDPILIAHRDFMFRHHIGLPLEF